MIGGGGGVGVCSGGSGSDWGGNGGEVGGSGGSSGVGNGAASPVIPGANPPMKYWSPFCEGTSFRLDEEVALLRDMLSFCSPNQVPTPPWERKSVTGFWLSQKNLAKAGRASGSNVDRKRPGVALNDQKVASLRQSE